MLGVLNLRLLIIIPTLVFTATAKVPSDKSVYGEKFVCKEADYPFFALIFKRGEVCGGALLTKNSVVLAKDCFISKLGKTTQKWVRIGSNPYSQFRRVNKAIVCRRKCSVAVVEVTRLFNLNKYVDLVGKPVLKACTKTPFYMFITYEKPWRRNRPVQMYCANINVKECGPDTIWTTTPEPTPVPTTRPTRRPPRPPPTRPTTRPPRPPPTRPTTRPTPTTLPTTATPDTTESAIEMICGDYGDNRLEDYDDYYSNNDGLPEVDTTDEPLPEPQTVCGENTGGPLMCQDRLLGFLIGYTCVNPDSKLLGFASAFVNLRELKKLTGKDIRKMTPWPMDFTIAEGRSLYQHDGFLAQFLLVVMTTLLFVFFY